jgi:hypothetical protein
LLKDKLIPQQPQRELLGQKRKLALRTCCEGFPGFKRGRTDSAEVAMKMTVQNRQLGKLFKKMLFGEYFRNAARTQQATTLASTVQTSR